MSSDDEPDNPVPTKKRRVQRACDWCRRKKRACDGLRMSEKKCTNCVENGLECTFAGAETKRRSYVDVLEARLELTESLLRKLGNPNASPPVAWSASSPITTHKSTSIPAPPPPGPGVELAALTIRSMNTPTPAPHEEDLAHIELTQDMEELSISHHRERFHGKSSGAMLVKAAVLAREGYEEKEMPWTSRRMHYWTYNPAKEKLPHVGPFVFPPPDLLRALIDLYFTHQNVYFPLLHRPTFLRSVFDDNLHTTDASFGAVVLLVCAIGARYSEDVRVCPPGAEPLRVGWEFFDQLPLIIDHLFVRPTLYHLQFYCLATTFLEFSTPASCWTLIGIGIRLAQDVGAHRLQNFGPGAKPTIEGELWKRAFWVLVCMDRQVSMSLGRPCTTQYEDFDAELPIEVDDEFWEGEGEQAETGTLAEGDKSPESQMGGEKKTDTPSSVVSSTSSSTGIEPGSGSSPDGAGNDPGKSKGKGKSKPAPFTQPPGKPSTITFFNCLIRLNNILGFSLQLLYGLSKAKALLAHRDDAWEEHIVAELDSALNGWVDSIPAHLRWDPNRPRTPQDDVFFDQSALLYCSYYTVQMTIHRPFIPAVRRSGAPTSLPSLAICTNAARSASHVIETSRLRKGNTPVPVLLGPAFTAGLVLLLNVWSGKRTGLPPQMNSAIFEVHKCMKAMRVCEGRWQSAGLFWDLLYELASIGHLPLPIPATPQNAGVQPIQVTQNDENDNADVAEMYLPPTTTYGPPPAGYPYPDANNVAQPQQSHPRVNTHILPMHVMGQGMAVSSSVPEQGALLPPTVYIPLAAQGQRQAGYAAPLPRPVTGSGSGSQQRLLGQPVYGFGRTIPTYTSDLGRLPVFHHQQDQPGLSQQSYNQYGMYGGFDGVVAGSGSASNAAAAPSLPSQTTTDYVPQHESAADPGLSLGTASSTSSWYPAQTSAAPFGFPDFKFAAASGPSAAPSGAAGLGLGMSDSEIMALFGEDALAFVEGRSPVPQAAKAEAASASASGSGNVNVAMPDVDLTNEDMVMWASAPMGLEVDDWSEYFSALSGFPQTSAGGGNT
ncbi:Zn(2)-C6 fungal-type domain-containing protein [Mycena indigotica]|uniref:Zn(2)-C6 fungal-type domain-containing protein n=1 Tax=Mycena indigotica TaxID=2126181 RepID=A0A8H6T676_9AGAR|nr:Zn(2)-C6 fungal-type domain-containing protein [Mycena indigotica]KAF7310165.1 Zn(2)-C6 fungal-type domain-containing protein [Mycena indigotica]